MSLDALQNVFRDVFDDEDLIIRPEMTAKDVPAWDSFNHINLIVAIEAEFGIRFTSAEVTGMKNVGELVKMLNKKECEIAWP